MCIVMITRSRTQTKCLKPGDLKLWKFNIIWKFLLAYFQVWFGRWKTHDTCHVYNSFDWKTNYTINPYHFKPHIKPSLTLGLVVNTLFTVFMAFIILIHTHNTHLLALLLTSFITYLFSGLFTYLPTYLLPLLMTFMRHWRPLDNELTYTPIQLRLSSGFSTHASPNISLQTFHFLALYSGETKFRVVWSDTLMDSLVDCDDWEFRRRLLEGCPSDVLLFLLVNSDRVS